MKVEDVMAREVVAVEPATPLKEVAAILAERGISGVPVVGADGEVVGVVSEGDFLFKGRGTQARHGLFGWLVDPAEERLKLEARTAGEAMTAPARTIAPWRSTSAAAAQMLEDDVNRLPVVDDQGRLVGIVTRADLVRAFARSDAEVAREIRREVLERTLWLRAPEAVTIAVDDGNVTVGGSVDTQTEAELVPELVGKVPGVVAVESSLRWRHENGSR